MCWLSRLRHESSCQGATCGLQLMDTQATHTASSSSKRALCRGCLTWPEEVDLLVVLAVVPAKGHELRGRRVRQQAQPLAGDCRARVHVHLATSQHTQLSGAHGLLLVRLCLFAPRWRTTDPRHRRSKTLQLRQHKVHPRDIDIN